jgi:hypothetical protein
VKRSVKATPEWGADIEGLVRFAQRQLKARTRHFFIVLPTMVMFLLLLVPAWNCIGLLMDPVYVYMVGSERAAALLICCMVLFVTSLITVTIFLHTAYEAKTVRSMFLIAGIFLSTLGIMLILFSVPMLQVAKVANREFVLNCDNGPKAKPLRIVFQELATLRATPKCKDLPSVAKCTSFSEYSSMDSKLEETRIAKYMEDQFQCSGFCEKLDAKGKQVYPPTLFSLSNYKISCDGMAGRHIRNFAENIAKQSIIEGVMLVSVAVVFSIAKLIGFCAHPEEPEAKVDDKFGAGYGATL